jgi:hypothetical protein
MINGEPEYVTTDFLVTESKFDRRQDVLVILEFLKNRKATGQLTVHLNQGGVTNIVVTQKSKAERES